MFAAIEHLGEGVAVQPHTNGSHLGNSIAPIDHVPAPSVHNFPEFREVFGCLVGVPFLDLIIGADVPEVSPLGVEGGWSRGHWFVILGVGVETFPVVFSFFFELWCGPHLEVIVGIYILGGFVGVVVHRTGLEVFLKSV